MKTRSWSILGENIWTQRCRKLEYTEQLAILEYYMRYKLYIVDTKYVFDTYLEGFICQFPFLQGSTFEYRTIQDLNIHGQIFIYLCPSLPPFASIANKWSELNAFGPVESPGANRIRWKPMWSKLWWLEVGLFWVRIYEHKGAVN